MTFSKVLAGAAFTALTFTLGTPAALAQAAETSAAETASADTTVSITHESLVAALSDIGGRVKAYNAAEGKDAEDIQVVDVVTVLSDDEADYADARARYVNFVKYLQNVAGKVSLLKDALAGAEVENMDLVAMDVHTDGQIVLFYDAREEAAQDTAEETAAPASTEAKADETGASSDQ